MIKKMLSVLTVGTMLILTGCMPWSDPDEPEVVKDTPKDKNENVTVISQTNTKDYRTIHADQPADARGYIGYAVSNRVDIDEIEMGLRRLSKSVYDPGKYFFQAGQYINQTQLENMIKRELTEKQKKKAKKNDKKVGPPGFNPPLGKGKNVRERNEANPEILSNVLEQDYLVKVKDGKYKLGGISLSLSFNDIYRDHVEDAEGKYYWAKKDLDNEKVKQKAKAYAEKALDRIRGIKGLKQVPVFIGLYLEAPPESIVPGQYFAKSYVKKGSNNIDNWKSVNENHVLFPSKEAKDDYQTASQNFGKFQDDVQNYFPNSVGVHGFGFYRNKELDNLTFEINIRFFDKTEIVSFANYVGMLLNKKFPFPAAVPVQVYINSVNRPEAIITKQSKDESANVHVYQH
ncbi:CamS family sex pheromone protein [Tuberibacillus sp. Marseille-P3662]|uniref:CamS family sex pheromone protein n=1 Tax=Tuberibacillus sp. Marseille-P3662 TaxID=1965358 RepID=UPI000A1CCCA9|nr:CamS family sex pheromone protein [Tuberibacillus sp. Marseille-P3662]